MVNLYMVLLDTYDYCLFVFAESRNAAKALCVNWFERDQPYTMWRAKTLKKDVDATYSGLVVDHPNDKTYSYVCSLGFGFTGEDEDTTTQDGGERE